MRRSRRGRAARRCAVLGLAAGAFGGGYLGLRDASVLQIREVQVTGVSSSEGAEVRRALTTAARRMTTLHVREDELRQAVREFASVARISTQIDFPHGLAVEVTERQPVAEVDIAGRTVPVGAGGRLMEGVEPARPLAQLRATRIAPGGRLTDRKALEAVAALAAAPEVLRHRVDKVFSGPKGLTLDVRSGPDLFFGSAKRVHAKWAATARILAEPSAAGAVYLDVRIPDRVAAGGLGTVPEPPADPLEANPQLQPEESANLDQ